MVTPTAAQQQIRDHEGLALLVVAPAGCGKTEALALRVAGLLDRNVTRGARRILVTTFSNRARDNIRDRLRSYLPSPILRDRVFVTNFHGLSARIFRAHARVIGLDPEMELPESDWIREQCLRWGWGWDWITPSEDALRLAKQQALDDARVEAFLQARGARGALQLERQRLTENRLTYDDLPRVAELILANDAVAGLYRSHFGAVIVDEFQDLTPQQLRIVNRIGLGKTTYAGDLAQGIYGFAGAQPAQIDAAIRAECPDVVEFAESHRSSPAVLTMVNSLSGLTGGLTLSSARPESWPGGGLAAGIAFNDPAQEGQWAVAFARYILERAPQQRIGVICRNGPRRETVDAIAERSGLPVYRWDDGVLDTETAKHMKVMLLRLNAAQALASADPVQYLREAAELETIADPDTRRFLAEALVWCLDKLRDGMTAAQVRDRIKVGDQDTLLTAPGLHLLSGHIGKGQQFDWVVVVGAEDGIIPDWRSSTQAARLEDARVLSVMLSRARHGVVVTHATRIANRHGKVRTKQATPYYAQLRAASPTDAAGVHRFLKTADWQAIAAR
ncbi:UvrD-helicase domain-containing protein [Kineosporia sp. A_224]|uniref:UvrD-helicase domain-containing protein n=1 Tax=Kineosporia sp. A_224 TaxID=1962180 RepID=UPI000B4A7971|nr:ATP-dependent helicase [Kineosporia sp. A_224]